MLSPCNYWTSCCKCYSARVAAANDSGAAGANGAAGVVGRLGCCTLALRAAAVEWVLI
jgi:hypothetical protein